MSWSSWNPFKKKDPASEGKQDASMPQLPADLADKPEAKGMMAAFYRKWKDPAFLKQMRVLAAHMQKEGVDIRDQKAVQAWVEKNKDAITSGKFNEAPVEGARQETFVKTGPDVGRNDPCHCGSGKKFKKCCATKE